MTFRLACGDVMPGCPARFEAEDRDTLMAEVADHAAREHDIAEVSPEVAAAIEAQVVETA